MRKNERHEQILRIIERNKIKTQEQLQSLLEEEGFNLTQATVSRDIRELNITKIIENGEQIYAYHKKNENVKMNTLFAETVVSIDFAVNIIVIKTIVGMAMAVASVVDGLDIPEVMGCVAGDDTVICIAKTEEEAKKVIEILKKV